MDETGLSMWLMWVRVDERWLMVMMESEGEVEVEG